MWNLPVSVKIGDKNFAIRNDCDYRVVLDVIVALNDCELELEHRIRCALFIFYEDLTKCDDFQTAINEMMRIIRLGKDEDDKHTEATFMDWEYDFPQLAPAISKVLGYSVRDENKYTHWWDFVGAFMEIPSECVWSTIVTIRIKKYKHKKLEAWEEEFCREHPELINLPKKYSQEEEETFSLFE